MPVEGSRHYQGAGIGQEGLWDCPNCGGENAGPLALGCTVCGAGRPGQHVGIDAPPPPPPPPAAAPLPPRQGDGPLSPYDHWAHTHPQGTVAEAYAAGYMEGVRAARHALSQQGRQAAPPEPTLDPSGKMARTIVAALGYFADQVLRTAPAEIESGEWCSVAEVQALIHQLTTTGAVHG